MSRYRCLGSVPACAGFDSEGGLCGHESPEETFSEVVEESIFVEDSRTCVPTTSGRASEGHLGPGLS